MTPNHSYSTKHPTTTPDTQDTVTASDTPCTALTRDTQSSDAALDTPASTVTPISKATTPAPETHFLEMGHESLKPPDSSN